MCVYLLSLIRCSSKAFHLSSLLDKFLPSPSRTQHASLMKDLMFYFSKGLQVTIFHDCHYLCTAQLKGRTQNNFRLMSTGTRLLFFFFLLSQNCTIACCTARLYLSVCALLQAAFQGQTKWQDFLLHICTVFWHPLGIFIKGKDD